MSLLDEVLPEYDVNEVHEAGLPVPPDEAWAALIALRPAEIRLLVPLMALRAVPGLVMRRRALEVDLRAPVLDGLARNGFLRLAEREGEEVVYGVVGRFWALSSLETIRRLSSPQEFAAFAEPGYARAAMNFAVRAQDGGSLVTTETRIAGTDDRARRQFARYWRVIGPGSAAIRISWLNAVRRRAQRG